MHPTKQSKADQLPSLEDILKDTLTVDEARLRLRASRKDYARDPEFMAGYLRAAIVNDICVAMTSSQLSKAALAEVLGKSRQYVGRVLNETANFTIDSMAEIACVLDCELRISLEPRRARMAITDRENLARFGSNTAALIKSPGTAEIAQTLAKARSAPAKPIPAKAIKEYNNDDAAA